MCFPAGPVGEDISVAAVKHDSIDTASELLNETLMEACKEAG